LRNGSYITANSRKTRESKPIVHNEPVNQKKEISGKLYLNLENK